MDSRLLLYRYLLKSLPQFKENTIYAYGNQNWSILAIGIDDCLKIQKPSQYAWGDIENFILANRGKYILGYMGYGLHESYQVHDSCFPVCLLFIPNNVIEFRKKNTEKSISEDLGPLLSLEKYAQKLLFDESFFQTVDFVVKWAKEEPYKRRLTVAYKVNLPSNVDMLKTFLYPSNQEYNFMYNIYMRLFDKKSNNVLEYVGFSPELIIYGKHNLFSTYKLSGTIPLCSIKNLSLYFKVMNEHNMSISNLRRLLRRLGKSVSSRPFFVSMNNIIHLCTIFKTRIYENLSISDLFMLMLMKGANPETAIELLTSLENFDRGPYYGNHILIKPDGTYLASQILRTIFNCNKEYYSIAGASIDATSSPFKEILEIYYKFKDVCFYQA